MLKNHKKMEIVLGGRLSPHMRRGIFFYNNVDFFFCASHGRGLSPQSRKSCDCFNGQNDRYNKCFHKNYCF